MNNHKKIQEAIDSRLASLQLDEGFINKKAHRNESDHKARRPLAVAVVICLCLALAIPVTASTMPNFNRLVALISPQLAQWLQPIAMVSEKNGIKMEVVAAINDDDASVAYVTMKDLTDSRIDSTMDLYDDYYITGASGFTSDVVDFDNNTGTATIRIQSFGSDNLDGQKVTLHIGSFLSGKHVFKDVDSGIDLKNIGPAQTEDFDMNKCHAGGGDLYMDLKKQGKLKILKPDAANLRFPGIDFMEISNIGMVDNSLHIQIKWKGWDMNNGYLYLTDNAGKTTYATNIALDSDSIATTGGLHREEFIFDIGQNALAQYRLKGYFMSFDHHVKGDWQTTFKIESVAHTKKAACRITKGSLQIDSVTVSPLGITLKGSGQLGPPDTTTDTSNQVEIYALTDSNNTINNFDINAYNNNGKITIKYIPTSPLEIAKIKAVVIDGNKIEFKD